MSRTAMPTWWTSRDHRRHRLAQSRSGFGLSRRACAILCAAMDESQFAEPTRRWLEVRTPSRHRRQARLRLRARRGSGHPPSARLPDSRLRLARVIDSLVGRLPLCCARFPRLRPLRQARRIQLLALPADGRRRGACEGAGYRRSAHRQPRRWDERAHGAARPGAGGAARLPAHLLHLPERQHAPGDGDDHTVPEAPRLERDAAAGRSRSRDNMSVNYIDGLKTVMKRPECLRRGRQRS